MGPTYFELWVMETELWVMETANPNSLLVTYFSVQRAKYKYLYSNYHILYIKYKVVFFF